MWSSVFSSRGAIKFLERVFGFSVLDYYSTRYFRNIVNKVVADKDSGDEDKEHYFVKLLAKKVVDVSWKDPDALVDDMGNLWSKKGNRLADAI